MGKGAAFGSCSRSQLFLIFGNTLAFFVAGTLLGYSIYVFSYMRTINTAVIGVCMGATTGVMIATGMGAWGALLKKHGVLKAYFYCVLLLNIVLLVTGTLCYIRADEIDTYVDYKYKTVKSAMPYAECDFCVTNGHDCTADQISQCKSNITSVLENNLRTMGACCIIVAILMTLGTIAAGRLLTWDRLTGPLLHGGGVVMIVFAIFNILMAVDFIVLETDAIKDDTWATYVAAGTGGVIVVLALLGVAGMQTKSPGALLAYQIFGFLSVILLGYLAVLSFTQFSDITQWARDNFDKDANVRSNLNDVCFCNNDDYDNTCGQIQCNAAASSGTGYQYYNGTGGILTLVNQTQPLKYCLSTSRCVDKAVDSAQAGLAAIGTMSIFFIVYLLICLSASHNVRQKMVEELRQLMAEGSQLDSPGTRTEMKSRV